MEHQRLAPLLPMWHPLVPYLYGMTHLVSCYDFGLKLGIKDVEIIKKNLKKSDKKQEKIEWQKLQEGWWDF